MNILSSIRSVTPGLAEWQVSNSLAPAALNGLLARTICAVPRWRRHHGDWLDVSCRGGSTSAAADRGNGVGVRPAESQPQEQEHQRDGQTADAIEEERRQGVDASDEPAEILAEEAGDERQRQEDRGQDRSCSMVEFCRTLTFVCSTEITAMLACSTVPSRSRCAATSSLTSSR